MNFYDKVNRLNALLRAASLSQADIDAIVEMLSDLAIQDYFFSESQDFRLFEVLSEKGFFDASQGLARVTKKQGEANRSGQWPALIFLEKMSQTAQPDARAQLLLRILRDITRGVVGQVDNYFLSDYLSKIASNLPADIVSLNDIELTAVWLNSRYDNALVSHEVGRTLLSRFLGSDTPENWEKAARLVEIAVRPKKVPGQKSVQSIQTLMDPYSLDGLFKKNAQAIGQKCGDRVLKALESSILALVNGEKYKDAYSYIWRPAIEDHAQNHGAHDAIHILISGLRDVLLAYAETHPIEAKDELRRLLKGESIVLARIAIYVMDQRFGAQKDLFFEIPDAAYLRTGFRHELIILLKNHFQELSRENQDKLVDQIDCLADQWPKGMDSAMSDAKLRRMWLQSIEGKGHSKADELFKKYLNIVGCRESRPEFPSYSEVSWRTPRVPKEDLLKLTVSQLVDKLISFKSGDGWKEPEEEDLVHAFQEAASERISDISSQLGLFRNPALKPMYIGALIRAFDDTWKKSRPMDWKAILEFCDSLVVPDSFWDIPEIEAHRGSIVCAIADLIETGTRNDASAFEEVLLPLAQKIIQCILDKIPSTHSGDASDAYTEALNTPRGRAIGTLFSLALRQCRLEHQRDKSHENAWKNLEPLFEHQLSLCRDGNYEFSSYCGAYLPNFLYLNKAWLTKNINKIFDLEPVCEPNWRCAIQGYAYSPSVYPTSYRMLKEGGHFAKALVVWSEPSTVREKILENLAIGYLHEWETLDASDSLFAQVLKQPRAEDMQRLLWFFWSGRDENLTEEQKLRILDFWRRSLKNMPESQDAQNAEVLSSFNLLAAYIPKAPTPEQKQWLFRTVPYMQRRGHESFFLEDLNRWADHAPQTVAEIYMKMLDGACPTFEPKTIQSIFVKLKEAGLQHEVNKIVNRYAENWKNYEFKSFYE